MTLSARLSAFFLAALALVLVGFALTVYLLARAYLRHQSGERLATALETLDAAVEREPDGLDWDPSEHHVTLGQDAQPGQVRWTVHDGQGRTVARSPNLDATAGGADWPAPLAERSELFPGRLGGERWQFVRRRVAASSVVPAPTASGGSPRYGELILTAGVSLAPQEETLNRLALVLTGLSTAIWLLAALTGRQLCRHALAPVRSMAAEATVMGADDLSQRLASPATGDELEELGRAFNGLLARLEEAFERQRRFTGDASHQLRTPLTALRGEVEVALRRDRSADEYRASLITVREQARRLEEIVEMLLFLSRADAESRQTELAPLDLGTWLAEHLRTWSEHPRGADVRQEATDEGVWVRAHGPLLGQLVDNLLDNACKYSQPGTPVVVRLGWKAGFITLEVEDAGAGIAPADLPHVFEPFYRAPEARRRGEPGVGLGLAVARRIAMAFGGTLTATSEPGHGSRFTLCLPPPLPCYRNDPGTADDRSAGAIGERQKYLE
jgi:heavy metal sensor kinase